MSEQEIELVIEKISKNNDSGARQENRLLTSVVGVLVAIVGYYTATTISDIKTEITNGNTEVRADFTAVWNKLNITSEQCTKTQQQVSDHIREDTELHAFHQQQAKSSK